MTRKALTSSQREAIISDINKINDPMYLLEERGHFTNTTRKQILNADDVELAILWMNTVGWDQSDLLMEAATNLAPKIFKYCIDQDGNPHAVQASSYDRET